MDWAAAWDDLYAKKTTRAITFRKAVLSGGKPTYPSEVALPAGLWHVQVGFDSYRGVYYTEDRVKALIWLRDWFGRDGDGATSAELAQMAADLRGDVVEGSKEHWSRFLVDGDELKYDHHAWDQRPDGTVFAVVVTLQAAR